MATIYAPVLLIGRERVIYIGRDTRMCVVYGTQNRAKRIRDAACERCKNQKSDDQDEKT